ncbi:hypothetical protein [Cohnella phaseoli]|uniref:Uncharacterized protein n=1 Tax=Cohnella phaseoli TaxID=456490 RepID=A0A3D9JQX1_9BACL|nr:hypothetical protein [Cohnella phaseoli]RED75947.1 hypothetical protein DFP98_1137 [Cohnella phaseoli]
MNVLAFVEELESVKIDSPKNLIRIEQGLALLDDLLFLRKPVIQELSAFHTVSLEHMEELYEELRYFYTIDNDEDFYELFNAYCPIMDLNRTHGMSKIFSDSKPHGIRKRRLI